jgi:hypothetical protein
MAVLCSGAGAASDTGLHRWWPRFPRPEVLLVVPFVGGHEEGMTFETAAGLAARAVLQGRGDTMLYEDVGSTSYVRWRQAMEAVVRPRCQAVADTWEAVARLRAAGIVRGYVLFRYDDSPRGFHAEGTLDESANVATSLSALLGAVAVSERWEAKAQALGLPLLLDARQRDEAWCLREHGDRCSRTVLLTADPKSRVVRHLGVALAAFTVSRPGSTYEAALARCEPGSPVLGWAVGDEWAQTLPSSQWGLFQTATNWCHNLPPLMTEEVGETVPRDAVTLPSRCRRELRDLRWEEGVHYAAFLLSDGDNVQWLMGNFSGGSEGPSYFESPLRGQFAFGWTFPYADLAQLCPYALVDLFHRATPQDDFVLYGAGYYYPDRFGEKRTAADAMRLHARRLGQYLRFAGLNSLALNAQDWDSEAAVGAYRIVAEEVPGLRGIFTVQYCRYSGGEGRILWLPSACGDMPIVSCRLTLWARSGRPRDTTPAGVAKWLDAMPLGGQGQAPGKAWSEDHFTFVMPHAWSTFRDTGDDPDPTAEEPPVGAEQPAALTSRGLAPVSWAVRRLQPQVRVVTPSELLLQVRLHLRTRQTLAAYAAELAPLAAAPGREAARDLLHEAQRQLPAVADADASGRHCFELLQRVDRLVR